MKSLKKVGRGVPAAMRKEDVVTSAGFLKEGAVIAVQDSAAAPFFTGAWKINRIDAKSGSAPLLQLESMYRPEKAFWTRPFDAGVMRPLQEDEVVYDDAFLPLGSTVLVAGEAQAWRNGMWDVDQIVAGQSQSDAAIVLRQRDPLPGIKASYMRTQFNARTMKVLKQAAPKLARTVLKAAPGAKSP